MNPRPDQTQPQGSPVPPRRSAWNRCRCSFRWFRISLLGLVLFVLALLTWLRLAGLPAFIGDHLIAELATRGVVAEFSSLHFQWFRGFVARDLRIQWGGNQGPRVAIDEADLDLSPSPWRENEPFVRGLTVLQGSLRVPLPVSNQPPAELRVDHLSADLRFLPNDAWEVRRLAAEVAGIRLELRAALTNVSSLRRAPETSDPVAVTRRVQALRRVIEELGRCSAPTPPRLEVRLTLDGRNPWAAHGEAYLDAPQWKTPRGSLEGLRLSLRAPPADSGLERALSLAVLEFSSFTAPERLVRGFAGRLQFEGPPRPSLPTNATWTARAARVRWHDFSARSVSAHGTNVVSSYAETLRETPIDSRASFQASQVRGRWTSPPALDETFGVERIHVSLDTRHTLSPAPPQSASFDLLAEGAVSGSNSLGQVRILGTAAPTPHPTTAPTEVRYWSVLWPWTADIRIEGRDLAFKELHLNRFDTHALWDSPRLRLSSLNADLHGGALQADADLDVLTRLATATAESTFDPHAIAPFLPPRSRASLQRYQWNQPPWFKGRAQVTLPVWTNSQPDWRGVVKKSVRLEGSFRVGAGSFKGVPFDEAVSSLTYDGESLKLPDLRTLRPEGRQRLVVEYHDESREYRVDAQGVVLPPVLKPLLGERSGGILDLFLFREPVHADLSIWGPWSEGTRQSILGQVHATNFIFRGEPFDRLKADVHYTNQFLAASEIELDREARRLTAEGVSYHFQQDHLSITNAVNTLEPTAVVALFSPGFIEKLAPYRFDSPPKVRVDGTIHPRDTTSADFEFQIDGGPFHFWRLSATQVATRLLWKGPTLVLTNLDAQFYGGQLEGHASFDISKPGDSPYQFSTRVRGAHLHDLLREATPGRTNPAQGTFDLDLDIDSARANDIHSWNGHGRADLRDGLLWDVPIFGFLSPVLNAFIPGLGNNRAERAVATFRLTNSVVHTRDLVIACPPVKLLYRGTIDFDQRVQAKVEGQILNDLAGFGPLLGFILRPLTKLLEFGVTGTLADVKAEPLYIPRFLLFPLQPGRVIRGIFREEDAPLMPPGEPTTNTPPLLEEPPGPPAPNGP